MSVLASTIRWDARLQWRYGIVAAAVVVTLAWVLVLLATPAPFRRMALPLVLFGDTALFGLFLLPGMIFLERGDRVLYALVASPLGWRRYLLAQMAPLMAIGLSIGIALAIALVDPRSIQWPALIAGLIAALAIFMLGGMALGVRFDSISAFIIPAAAFLTPAQLPLLHALGVWQSPIAYAIPTMAPLLLMRGALEPLAPWQWLYASLVSALTVVAGWLWAGHSFRHHIGAGSAARRHLWTDRHRQSSSSRVDSEPRDHARPPDTATRRVRGGALALASLDLRIIAREPIMGFIALYALILAVAARFLLPIVDTWLQTGWGIALSDYQPLVASVFVVLTNPLLLGAVLGLLLLDERDEGSLTALRATPLGMARYAAWRSLAPMTVCMAFSMAATVILAPVITAAPPPLPALFGVALLAALEVPLAALVVATLATNKVEGLAVIKGLGFLILGPFLSWWVGYPARWLFGVLPTWWPTEAYWRFSGEPGNPMTVLLIGFAIHGALLFVFVRRFIRRM